MRRIGSSQPAYRKHQQRLPKAIFGSRFFCAHGTGAKIDGEKSNKASTFFQRTTIIDSETKEPKPFPAIGKVAEAEKRTE